MRSPPSGGEAKECVRAVLFSWKWICIGSHFTLPLAGVGSAELQVPPRGCHVTVYSSSRWFLQISAAAGAAAQARRAGPWRQQEGCAPAAACQMLWGVAIVFAGHHGNIDGEGQSSHGEAGQEVEDPALPGGG